MNVYKLAKKLHTDWSKEVRAFFKKAFIVDDTVYVRIDEYSKFDFPFKLAFKKIDSFTITYSLEVYNHWINLSKTKFEDLNEVSKEANILIAENILYGNGTLVNCL